MIVHNLIPSFSKHGEPGDRTNTHTVTVTYTHSFTLSLSLSLSHTHTHTHTHTCTCLLHVNSGPCPVHISDVLDESCLLQKRLMPIDNVMVGRIIIIV